MTETPDVKKGRGTGWIVAAAAVYVWGLLVLVQPAGEFVYKAVGVIVLATLGTWFLLRGLRKRV
jgi:hypothetical protein